MKSTNLNVFYQLGLHLEYMFDKFKIDDEVMHLFTALIFPRQWLGAFISETAEVGEALKDTRDVAVAFLGKMDALYAEIPRDFTRKVTQIEMWELSTFRNNFQECFEREHRNLDVFTVTPKGLYSTRLLINNPENDFPVELRAALPDQSKYDLQQAARCLAFDVPTACAFHVCRATESIMLAYFEKLAGHKWHLPKNRDWGQYIDWLNKKGAPLKIVERLKEIKDSDRNAFIHPDINVPLDEAHAIFSLCSAVNLFMMKEIVK
jgi:hypothetical protein